MIQSRLFLLRDNDFIHRALSMWNVLNSSIYHIYRMITYDNKVLIIIINNSTYFHI